MSYDVHSYKCILLWRVQQQQPFTTFVFIEEITETFFFSFVAPVQGHLAMTFLNAVLLGNKMYVLIPAVFLPHERVLYPVNALDLEAVFHSTSEQLLHSFILLLIREQWNAFILWVGWHGGGPVAGNVFVLCASFAYLFPETRITISPSKEENYFSTFNLTFY